MISGFYAVATAGTNPDMILVDNLTAFAPSLRHMQWTKANNAVNHSYREVAEIKGITDVYDFDSPIADLSVSFSLQKANLTPYAGKIELGSDAAKQIGNHENYFVEQAKFIARDLGMKLENSIFKRIVRTAVDTNRRWMMFDDDLSETVQNTCAIVTWQGDETCGLFSPAYGKVDSDRLFELEKLSSGNLYMDSKNVPVFGSIFKVVLGILLANKRMYGIVTNIDTEHPDFAKDFPERMSEVMDEMLVNSNTMILMSNKLKTRIGNHYTTQKTGNTLVRFDEKCNLSVCGVPVVHSANIPVKVDWSKIPSLNGQTVPASTSAGESEGLKTDTLPATGKQK
jgi:hypothetical protein